MMVMIAPTTAPTVTMIAPSARCMQMTTPLAEAGGVVMSGLGRKHAVGERQSGVGLTL
jgi:hypothetical protein